MGNVEKRENLKGGKNVSKDNDLNKIINKDIKVSKNIKNSVYDRERKVLNFWNKNNIFKKSEEGISLGFLPNIFYKIFGKKRFIFYDGPPFATGLPHYGHILAGSIKDALPRYKTMKGFIVNRKWGWDCHGLPLEVEIEKELGLSSRKDIEKFGIDNFNSSARSAIFRYASEWKNIIPKMGRWVDMDNDYRTLQPSYMESVWNVFQRLHSKGLIEKGFKPLHLCPRCSTTLSNSEVSDSYSDLKDIAVYVLFPAENDKNTYFVGWTTTPWTLFGNVALAVNKNLKYVVVEKDGKKFILHEDKVDLIPEGKVIDRKSGSEFIGMRYRAPFEYMYINDSAEIKNSVYGVHHADYVNADTGTGIVHMAPAYGADDMELAQEKNMPIRHHVTRDGVLVSQLEEFAGMVVKEEGNPKDLDEKIIDALKKKNVLLKSEILEHSYPVCWRCDTPLLNYASDSWFVKTSQFRDKMVSENKKIGWIPSHIRDGRFGKWLEGAQDWAISRSRFWGTPLPVWEVEKTKRHIVVGSINEMMEKMQTKNKYRFIRHAESETNKKEIFCHTKNNCGGITEKGIEDTKNFAKSISQKPTIIIYSPLERTKETAEIIAKELGVKKVISEPLVSEQNFGLFSGKPVSKYIDAFNGLTNVDVFDRKIDGSESKRDIYKRILSFMEKVDSKYSDEDILVVTHGAVLKCALSISPLFNDFKKKFCSIKGSSLDNLSVHEIEYKHITRDEHCEIDIHRPFIDDIVLYDEDGNPAYNIKEVFDCWFESGSMPYASSHYPFSNKSIFNPEKKIGFPADFICEGLDQTRGWFFSLIQLGVGAYESTPYKQVITTGLIRASDGKKMSKKLKNYSDPTETIEKYGADSLRHYLLGSPVSRGQDIDFQDENINEIQKKIYGRLHNCFNFYRIYAYMEHKSGSRHILDRYILSRLSEVIKEMTENFDSYKIDRAVAPIGDFVEDLSTWYLRRSRDRMKNDSNDGAHSRETMRRVLIELSKCIAPIAPFYSEYLYLEMKKLKMFEIGAESVHLCKYPNVGKINNDVIKEMKYVRRLASLAHESRVSAGIKVRQPLQTLTVKKHLSVDSCKILADEINVKNVVISEDMTSDLKLDMVITPELKEEGFIRECVRSIQLARKENGFSITEVLDIAYICSSDNVKINLQKAEEKIKKEVRIDNIEYIDSPKEGSLEYSVGREVISISFKHKAEKMFG